MSIIVQIAFLAVTLYVAHCYQIVINELNIDNPVEPERHEFVELVGYDNEGKMVNKGSLRGYKMLLISSYQSGSKGPTIELVANLYNANIKNSFFVLGGFDVPNTSMTVESNMVASRKKLMRNQGILNWMTNANEHLFAVVLVHSINSTDLSRLWLSKSQPYLNLKDHVQTIKHHLKDIVVYGRRAPQERCGIFEELNPNFTETKYVLREFDGGSKDFSLNRCTLETRPMLPKSFKLGKPTPGSTNDCSGTRFILEETILEVSNSLSRNYRSGMDDGDGYDDTTEAGCSSSRSSDEYYSVRSGKVSQYVQTLITANQMRDICPLGEGGEDLSQDGNLEEEISRADIELAQMTNGTKRVREWELSLIHI